MACRTAGNLYAISSLSPVVGDTKGVSTVYSCLPVDMTADGSIPDDTRYLTIVSLPLGWKSNDILPFFDYARPYVCQWLTYIWEVS